MRHALTLFIGMFSTLLSAEEHRSVARRSCVYVLLLMFFFLVFGTLILRIFGVPLSMVRIVGGIILMRIGFELFSASSAAGSMVRLPGGTGGSDEDVAFVPLAMPIMFGPGAIATILGMASVQKESEFEILAFAALGGAIALTMFVTYLFLAYARNVVSRIGPKGIDAATRIVGFFVSAMGMGLIFHGVIEAFQAYGVIAKP